MNNQERIFRLLKEILEINVITIYQNNSTPGIRLILIIFIMILLIGSHKIFYEYYFHQMS